MAAGGVVWQMLRIKKRGRGDENEKSKGTWWCRKNEGKVLEAQLLGSELEEARGRCAGPFPSLARDPTLQVARHNQTRPMYIQVVVLLIHTLSD
jgi:hypothetical protein